MTQELADELRCDELITHGKEGNRQACNSKVELLEVELANARESERKMLDSLTSQTRQLEQTMISLEEAKLEIRYLNEAMRRSHDTSNETKRLRDELNQALAAEEKSKKAMDDLAVALKEATTESNSAKKSYFQTQSELERLRAEAGRLRSEVEESSAAWQEKENGFIDCIRILEDEIEHARDESRRLTESQRSARVEISKLRDIVKQAVNESNIVKEALEIARDENSQLKDLLAEKDNAYLILKQDHECLKVCEAAAMDSVKELSSLLATSSSACTTPPPPLPPTTTTTTAKSISLFDGSIDQGMRMRPMMTKFPSENWKNPPWSSPEESRKLDGSIFDMFDRSPEGERERDQSINRFRIWEEGVSPSRLKKKKQILRRFGDILRFGSCSGSIGAPVVSRW